MLEIGLDMFITLIIYLTIPVIYVFAKGKEDRKKATKIALWNSLIGLVIICAIKNFFIPNSASIIISTAPTVFYFFLNRWILTDKSKSIEKKQDLKVSNEISIGETEPKEHTRKSDEVIEEEMK